MMISRSSLEERPQPRAGLQQVGDDVPVQQHRALGDARRAARVLQERDVVVRERHPLQLAACGPRRARRRGGSASGIDQAGIIFFTCRSTKSTMMPLKPSSSPMLVTITCRTFVRPSTSCHRVREILDDDDHLGARVGQLVLELARRVERIDVHHRAAGAQDAEQANRVLQDVGHHQRDARALLAAVRLQLRAERGGQRGRARRT